MFANLFVSVSRISPFWVTKTRGDPSLLLVSFEFDLSSQRKLLYETSNSSSVHRRFAHSHKKRQLSPGRVWCICSALQRCRLGGRALCKQQQLNECSCLGRHGLRSGSTRIKRRGLRCPAFPTWGLIWGGCNNMVIQMHICKTHSQGYKGLAN